MRFVVDCRGIATQLGRHVRMVVLQANSDERRGSCRPATCVRADRWRAGRVAGREKEEGSANAVGDMQSAQRVHHRLRTMLVGGNRQHPERLPSEMLLVLFGGMRGHVGATGRERVQVVVDCRGTFPKCPNSEHHCMSSAALLHCTTTSVDTFRASSINRRRGHHERRSWP